MCVSQCDFGCALHSGSDINNFSTGKINSSSVHQSGCSRTATLSPSYHQQLTSPLDVHGAGRNILKYSSVSIIDLFTRVNSERPRTRKILWNENAAFSKCYNIMSFPESLILHRRACTLYLKSKGSWHLLPCRPGPRHSHSCSNQEGRKEPVV